MLMCGLTYGLVVLDDEFARFLNYEKIFIY